jgi:hypothetical protein
MKHTSRSLASCGSAAWNRSSAAVGEHEALGGRRRQSLGEVRRVVAVGDGVDALRRKLRKACQEPGAKFFRRGGDGVGSAKHGALHLLADTSRRGHFVAAGRHRPFVSIVEHDRCFWAQASEEGQQELGEGRPADEHDIGRLITDELPCQREVRGGQPE